MLIATTYMFENVKDRYFPDSHKLPSLSVIGLDHLKKEIFCTFGFSQIPVHLILSKGQLGSKFGGSYKHLIFSHVFCFNKIDVLALNWMKIEKIFKICQLKM